MNRCYNPRNKDFPEYGDRGIVFCEGMRRDFLSFLRIMGPKPSPQHSLDRIDGDLGYVCGECPECRRKGWPRNCRWATHQQQMQNRRTTRFVTHNGETQCIAEWARRLGISKSAMRTKVLKGWGQNGKRDEVVAAKNRAHQAVYKAVHRGALVKPNRCQHPGCEETELQAHHYLGYGMEYRLDVKWYCRRHHAEHEREATATPYGRAKASWHKISESAAHNGLTSTLPAEEEYLAWFLVRESHWLRDRSGEFPAAARKDKSGPFGLDNLVLVFRRTGRNYEKSRLYAGAPPGTKHCGKCKRFLPFDRFSPGDRAFGLAPRCKECRRVASREMRQKEQAQRNGLAFVRRQG